MNEIWKDINNYEGIYQISNLGNVRSLDREQIDINGVKRVFKGQMLTKSLGNWGYYTVSLKKNSQSKKFFVHRLVAQEFIPNPNNLEVVNHKDGNKLNNISDNLEWISLRDNTLYSQHSNKKKILQYSKSGEFIKIWDSITEAAKYFQVNVSLISQCLSNKISSAANYVWRYYYENFPEKIDTNGLNFSKKYCYQYDLEGNFIKEWKTRSQAEKELNIASGILVKLVLELYLLLEDISGAILILIKLTHIKNVLEKLISMILMKISLKHGIIQDKLV